MPLTAWPPARGLLDTTRYQLGAGISWTELRALRPELSCTSCGQPMHTVDAPGKHPYFAHNPSGAPCEGRLETPAHRALKVLLVQASEAAGGDARVEKTGPRLKADVLVTMDDGYEFSWEIQQESTDPSGKLWRRTAARTAAGAGVCWITTKKVPWLLSVPSVRLRWVPAESVMVVDGLRTPGRRPAADVAARRPLTRLRDPAGSPAPAVRTGLRGERSTAWRPEPGG